MVKTAHAELLPLTPQVRETLQERVYRELRVALMRGRFPPGRSLTIRAVAAALGTSPMPVREALRQLVAERALDMMPNRSFGIPLMTRQRFADLRRIRVEIEGFAAAEAAKRMDRDSINYLVQINNAMLKAGETGDRELYIARNQEFHFRIYEASGSEVILPIIETLWLQIGPYLNYVFSEPQPSMSLDHHVHIIEALRSRNSKQVRNMVGDDIGDAVAIIEKYADFAD